MNRGVDDEIIKICVWREGWIWSSMQKSRTWWHEKGLKEVIDSCEKVSLGYQKERPSFIHITPRTLAPQSQCPSPIGAFELFVVLKTPPPTAFDIPTPRPVIAPIKNNTMMICTTIFCFLLNLRNGLQPLRFLNRASSCFLRNCSAHGHTLSSSL